MAKPTLPASHATKADRVLWWWASLAAVLLIAIGGLAIAVIAEHSSGATADCVNSILGVRAPLADADHANERQKIADQTVATRDESAGLKTALNPANTQAERLAGVRLYQRGVAEFQKSLADWKTRDDLIAAKKRLAPLGRC